MIDLKQGDCLELMKDISDKSVDMILCDLPYGTTSCSWDSIIPFEDLWKQYNRIIKDKSVIVVVLDMVQTTINTTVLHGKVYLLYHMGLRKVLL